VHLQHNHGANVSAFYHEEAGRSGQSLDSEEEEKDDQLRVPNSDSSDLQCRETEISQPILHLMHMHRMGAQQHRFSNASANQSHNYASEEHSGFQMGHTDEFNEHRLASGSIGDYNRGRQQSITQQKVQPVYQKT
jgi:hypothetical protein